MKPIKAQLVLRSSVKYSNNLYRVVCESKEPLPKISAGQFAHLKVPNKNLRRPVCVYRNTVDTLTFIIADVGEGTNAFVTQNAGAEFDALLPLGNGFPVLPDKTNIALLGGGTGCAPLFKIAEDNPSLNCTHTATTSTRSAKRCATARTTEAWAITVIRRTC